ncbi:hypothetical protein HELRODRAFT_165904 [Helobdella robusta]|uniref:Uncharacterized protein n=1 Tax=Helobdella robusta TaxID=6412 RepID=T1EXF3_HELRO|nr:hypothetical protein HELRODRAFT_165904 [Helobdella robusta]ESN91822.1 hypothetical protein HELRODRAFT_165904 [Helobdella robusta]
MIMITHTTARYMMTRKGNMIHTYNGSLFNLSNSYLIFKNLHQIKFIESSFASSSSSTSSPKDEHLNPHFKQHPSQQLNQQQQNQHQPNLKCRFKRQYYDLATYRRHMSTACYKFMFSPIDSDHFFLASLDYSYLRVVKTPSDAIVNLFFPQDDKLARANLLKNYSILQEDIQRREETRKLRQLEYMHRQQQQQQQQQQHHQQQQQHENNNEKVNSRDKIVDNDVNNIKSNINFNSNNIITSAFYHNDTKNSSSSNNQDGDNDDYYDDGTYEEKDEKFYASYGFIIRLDPMLQRHHDVICHLLGDIYRNNKRSYLMEPTRHDATPYDATRHENDIKVDVESRS